MFPRKTHGFSNFFLSCSFRIERGSVILRYVLENNIEERNKNPVTGGLRLPEFGSFSYICTNSIQLEAAVVFDNFVILKSYGIINTWFPRNRKIPLYYILPIQYLGQCAVCHKQIIESALIFHAGESGVLNLKSVLWVKI